MTIAARTARLSMIANAALIAAKLTVGIVTGSVSVVSESIHSVVDLAAASMTFFSVRMSATPADSGHPYGHGKFENVSGALEAALILAAAGLIIYEAVGRLFASTPLEHPELGAAVMFVSGALNFVVSRRLYRTARSEDSVALEADALNLKTDVYPSFGVGAALVAEFLLGRYSSTRWASYLDPVAGILVASFVAYEGLRMLGKAAAPLLDAGLSAEEMAIIQEQVARYHGVGIHAVRTRKSGRTKLIDFHLSVPEGMTVRESHELCDSIEYDLERALSNTNVLIHVEPALRVASAQPRTLSKEELVARLASLGREVAGYDLGVHHVHLYDRNGRTEITFHINVEAKASLQEAHLLASKLETRVRSALGFEPTIHVEPTSAR